VQAIVLVLVVLGALLVKCFHLYLLILLFFYKVIPQHVFAYFSLLALILDLVRYK
jgi:hypothetical protein